MKSLRAIFLFYLIIIYNFGYSQVPSDTVQIKHETTQKQSLWYESVSIRGYTQTRYNRLLETNPKLKCEQCDRSWGENGGFFFRRIRIIFFGQLSENVYFYIQPDFASSASSTALHFGQIRDAYVDIGLDKKNEFRFRIGQSKVPYGFENLQSSQNRITLDRNDGLNSAVSNERDIGVFFYWATKEIRDRFSMLVKDGLKGSGDYGIIGFGAFNGQTANKLELNNQPHFVGRVTYPFLIRNQILETSIQAYKGRYVMPSDLISSKVRVNDDFNYLDERIAGSVILYPKPFGLQAEYNIGNGPEYDKTTESILNKELKGGYVLLNYRIVYNKQNIIPFSRYQFYQGGKKHERDARSYEVKEWENGIEWQLSKNFELVAMYTISERRFEDQLNKDNIQKGNLLRLQAQVNF